MHACMAPSHRHRHRGRGPQEFYRWFFAKGKAAGMVGFEPDFMNQNYNCVRCEPDSAAHHSRSTTAYLPPRHATHARTRARARARTQAGRQAPVTRSQCHSLCHTRYARLLPAAAAAVAAAGARFRRVRRQRTHMADGHGNCGAGDGRGDPVVLRHTDGHTRGAGDAGCDQLQVGAVWLAGTCCRQQAALT